MKYLLVLLVVGIALYLLLGRVRRGRGDAGEGSTPPRRGSEPAAMLACAHCGVHLPRGDALVDAGGRGFCSEAHRVAGPR